MEDLYKDLIDTLKRQLLRAKILACALSAGLILSLIFAFTK